MHPSLKNFFADENHVRAALGNVFVVVWRQETTVTAVEAIHQGISELLRTSSAAGYAAIVEPGASMPSSSARDALARIFQEHGQRIPMSVIVIEGSGLRAAAQRSVMTAIALLAPAALPSKAVSSVEEGVALLTSRLSHGGGETPTSAALVAAIAELRRTPRTVANG